MYSYLKLLYFIFSPSFGHGHLCLFIFKHWIILGKLCCTKLLVLSMDIHGSLIFAYLDAWVKIKCSIMMPAPILTQ
jgi:hypothetical protein